MDVLKQNRNPRITTFVLHCQGGSILKSIDVISAFPFLLQVSWIRRKDYHLLTVGLATYSSDDRFLVEHARHLQVLQ
jgi:hypothetical protein